MGHHQIGGFGQRGLGGGDRVAGKAAEFVQPLLQQVDGAGVAAREFEAEGVFHVNLLNK